MSARRRGNAGTFDILVDSKEDVPQVEKAVDDMFHNAPTQTKTESESAFFLSFVSFLGNIKLFLMSICAAVTFTILLVSANTIAMSVRERVREVGVLKALGYTRNIILGLILGEATVIAFCGGVVGLLLAAALAGAVRNMPGVNFFPQFKNLTIVPPVAALCLLLAAGIGLASSFVPALGASRISIVDALEKHGVTKDRFWLLACGFLNSDSGFNYGYSCRLQFSQPPGKEDHHGDDGARHRADGGPCCLPFSPW